MLAGFLLAASMTAGVPSIERIEPEAIQAYRSAELVIRGSGFAPGCRALIGARGRFVPVNFDVIDASEIRVRLAAGYGPEPARRQVVIDCGPGRRSTPFPIEVVREMPEPVDTPTPFASSEDTPLAPSDDDAEVVLEAPEVSRIDPEAVPAGELATLTIMGSGFADGAEVEIYANSNAGSSRPPAYEMLRFPAEVASDTVLLVDLDRGFAPSPRLRRLVVVNPDGGTSAPVYLTVQRRLP